MTTQKAGAGVGPHTPTGPALTPGESRVLVRPSNYRHGRTQTLLAFSAWEYDIQAFARITYRAKRRRGLTDYTARMATIGELLTAFRVVREVPRGGA